MARARKVILDRALCTSYLIYPVRSRVRDSLIDYSEAKMFFCCISLFVVVLMAITIKLNFECLHRLDLSPAAGAIAQLLAEGAIASDAPQLRFEIDYPIDPTDPREFSEIQEVRLWFIRLDARYPWLPILLTAESGELARYVAMLVPHQFHPKQGIQYNPEALEIFLMHKIFAIADWLHHLGIPSKSKLKSMALQLGYDLDDSFFASIGT